jgi:hypothetical protein
MRSHVATLAALAFAASVAAGCAQRSRVVELHRAAFETDNPAHPYTLPAANAQIELAAAYAEGRGVARDPEFACGLALATLAATPQVIDDEELRARAQRSVDELCAPIKDLEAAERLTACPIFGVKPETLSLGEGAVLRISRTGLRLEDASGVHEDSWIVDCGEIVVSPRIVRAGAPADSPYAPVFLEWFLWRPWVQRDRSMVPGRRLEWRVVEITAWGLPQAEGEVLLEQRGASIWPVPTVPPAIRGGATLRLLPSGEVQWYFEGAPQLGHGTIGLLGGLPPAP